MTNQLLELTWSNKDLALIPTETGKYGYRWVSPSDPRYCETHTLEITDHVVGTQAPKEDGVTYSARADLTPTDDNLLILGESGDVLEALTRVPELADKYAGQVKCIYIDPPFNTAQTFTHYEDNLQHSVWLTMMRDRLQHMHTLLSDEGSIWVHLDDVENHRMRVLLDEVFGPENFVATIAWQKRTTRDNRGSFSPSHDCIHVYSKEGESNWKENRNRLKDTGKFSNPDNDPRGPWRSVPMSAQAGRATASQFWTVTTPTGVQHQPPRGRAWTYTEPRFKELEKAGMIYWPRNGDGKPRLKKFPGAGDGLVPNNWWTAEEVGDNDSAKKALLAMFPDTEAFETPKPERLLERVLHIATNPGDIVLDVFAGSGTTAAVAQKMGRRWITCELQEDNFTKFTRPRLEKVIHGEDHGGITTTKGERIPAASSDLPEGMSTEEAQKFTSLLNKLISDDDDLKKNTQVKALKAMAKTTKTPDTVNWRGGGGFAVARLSPACFDFDETLGLTLLTDAATGDNLINSVAANLNFHFTPDDPVFHGVRGRMRLVVVEGTLLTSRVDELLAELADDELLTIATTEPDEAVRSYLRQVKRGCRLVHIPDDIFHPTTAAGLLADDTVQEA
ncbi:site-specific DNA-methyltransferase [Corynebacterium variabile]|uniref:site-specific DNA-methyltransferase n=1 Tax=Corynebacterium variabile TaxID=1727 RepID=UPI003FD2669A